MKTFIISILLLLLLLLSIPTFLFAQSDNTEFKIIDSIPLTKQELYVRARSFVAKSFKNSKNVIQMDDKEAGRIICKGSMHVTSKGAFGKYRNIFDFTLTVDVRDNKYRLVMSDIYHSGLVDQPAYAGGSIDNEKSACGAFLIPKGDWRKIKDAIKKGAWAYLLEFQNAMNKKIEVDTF